MDKEKDGWMDLWKDREDDSQYMSPLAAYKNLWSYSRTDTLPISHRVLHYPDEEF